MFLDPLRDQNHPNQVGGYIIGLGLVVKLGPDLFVPEVLLYVWLNWESRQGVPRPE